MEARCTKVRDRTGKAESVRLNLEIKVLKFKHSCFSPHIYNVNEVVLVAKSMKLIGTTFLPKDEWHWQSKQA